MAQWSYSKAVAAIERLELGAINMAFACHWLSLWRGDQPPEREDFSPSQVTSFLSGIAVCEMHGNGMPVCRLAGTSIESGLGFPVTGTNMLDYLPNADRALRVARVSALVFGGVAVSRTAYRTRTGMDGTVETVQFPFCGVSETGSRQFISHVNWRPSMGRSVEDKAGFKMGFPDSYLSLPIS